MPAQIPDDSVGIISPKTQRFDEPLTLRSGRILESYELIYETYGTLNPDASNAILICHALSGDHHAAGFHSMTISVRVGGIPVSAQANPLILINSLLSA